MARNYDPQRARDITYLMASFALPGSLEGGGVTRLSYSKAEDEMHRIFEFWGKRNGFRYFTDEVGNSFLANSDEEPYVLIGSHLDSVIQGGRFDGVAGVAAGMACLKWLHEAKIHLPLRVAAFRCEESANFGRSTLGSGLVTHTIDGPSLANFVGREGMSIGQVFYRRGLSLTPEKIHGMSEYLEMHIEQGKVLEKLGKEIGIVEAIAGPRRYRVRIEGLADHSGATPMDMRSDALCSASELILAIERIGQSEAPSKSVATVGVVQNTPNAMNVIPGIVELGVDTRGIDLKSIDRMEEKLRAAAAEIAGKRGVKITVNKQSEDVPAIMYPEVKEALSRAAGRLGFEPHFMSSGAGHDALGFAEICPTGMVFIPCRGGISHNVHEYTTMDAIADGAMVLYEYLLEKAGV